MVNSVKEATSAISVPSANGGIGTELVLELLKHETGKIQVTNLTSRDPGN
jgi:hypothetical protein